MPNSVHGAVIGSRVITEASTTDTQTYDSNFINVASDALILMWVVNSHATDADTVTISSFNGTLDGLTWVQVDTQLFNNGDKRITLFRAMAASPLNGRFSVNVAGSGNTGAAWSVVQFQNVDTSGTNGSGAIVQSAKNSSVTAPLTITLSAFSSVTNGTAAGFGSAHTGLTNHDSDGGWTELSDDGYATPDTKIGTQWLATNDTTATATGNGADVDMGGISVEIKNADKSSLIGYWKLDETTANTCSGGVNDACDSSGYSNDGTWNADTSPNVSLPGIAFTNPRSVYLDGTGDYIDLGIFPAINNVQRVTLSFWGKRAALNAVLSFEKSPDGNDTTGIVLWSSGIAYGEIYENNGGNYGGFAQNDTNWHLYTVVFDGTLSGNTNRLKFYLDGSSQTLDFNGTTIPALWTTSGNLEIGGYFWGDSNGYYDDVRVYNRALSQTEITALAAGTHTTATWTGTTSTVYEVGSNWSTGAIPDAYTHVIIADVTNDPIISANQSLASLTIDSGGVLDLAGFNLTINDSGTFVNNGTLKLTGANTLTGFTNDTDTGTIIYTGTSSYVGLVAGNSYNDLTFDGSGGTWTLNAALDVNDDLTITTGTLAVSGTNYGITVGGDWTDAGAGALTEGTGIVTFDGTGTLAANETFNSVTINSGGTVTLGADLAISSALTITSGTLSGSTYTITLSGTGTVFNNSGTYTAGSSTITLTDTSSTSKTFAGGGSTFNILNITGTGTGAVIVQGSNTFATFTINPPKTVTFTSGTTQTITSSFGCTGTSGNVITINASGGTAATLSKSSGTVTCDYLSLTNSIATGGATWDPGSHSTNVSGNTGWSFVVASTPSASNPSVSGGTPLIYPLGGGGGSILQEDQAMIEKLLKLIESLKKQIQDIINSKTKALTNFNQDLNPSQTHPDVKRLQQFLNTHGFLITATGPGSPGSETLLFGQNTKQALIKFQEAHKTEILTPQGLTQGNGRLGPGTRAYINGIK